MTRMQRPGGHVTTYTYDELNRLIKVTDPLGFETEYRYDAAGNRTYARDPNGNESFYTYDADNLLRELLVLNGLTGKHIEYTYDAAHQQLTAVQSLAQLSAQGGEPTTTMESSLTRTYTILGQVATETRQAAGQAVRTVTYDYDYLGNIAAMLYPTAAASLEYQYNNLGQLIGIPGFIESLPGNPGIVYGGGLPQTVRYANGVELHYVYDGNGRLESRTDVFAGNTLYSITLNYDNNGNIQSRTVNGHINTYTYDDLNQLETANVYAHLPELVRPADYDLGKVIEDYTGTKVIVEEIDDFVVDLDYAATSLGVIFDGLTQNISHLELTPDESVNRLNDRRYLDVYYQDGTGHHKLDPEDWEFSLDGPTGRITIAFPDLLSAYEVRIHCRFDDRDADFQPIDASEFSNLARSMVKVYRVYDYRQESYIYDANGNRSSETITTLYPRTYDYSYYTNTDRLKTRISTDGGMRWAFVYDNNGNLIKKGNTFTSFGEVVDFTVGGEGVIYWEYDYDVFNRLTAVRKNGAETSRYVYDPVGLRIYKDGTKDVLYDFDLGGNVICETDLGTGEVRSYVWVAGRHLARVDGVIGGAGEKYFYECDHLGSPQVVTDKDGEPVWRGDFTPFGEKIEGEWAFVDTHGFTGKDWDEDAGLYYFNARWYDPELGRFISEDPFRDALNWYIYVTNNPLRFKDPTGLWRYEVDYETGEIYAIAECYDDDGDGKADRHDTLWGLSEEYYGTGIYSGRLKKDNDIKDEKSIQVGQRIKLPDYNDTGRKSHIELIKGEFINLRMDINTLCSIIVKTGLSLEFTDNELAHYSEMWEIAIEGAVGDDQRLADLLKQRFGFDQFDPNSGVPISTQFYAWQQEIEYQAHLQNTPKGIYTNFNITGIAPVAGAAGVGITFGWINDGMNRHFYIGPAIGTTGISISGLGGQNVTHGGTVALQIISPTSHVAQIGYNFMEQTPVLEAGLGFPVSISLAYTYTW